MFTIFILIVAYLIGSIPFGLILTKLFGYGDIRDIGSGNIGATNVLRTGNKHLALATLLLDAAKGATAVILASFFVSKELAALAGVCAVLGHIFPVWLGFKGGKGVATTLATWLVIDWVAGLFACCVWLLVFYYRRISSLSAIVAMASSFMFSSFFSHTYVAYAVSFLALVVIACHHENIRRLLAGKEPASKVEDQ